MAGDIYIKLKTLDALEIQGDRVLPRLGLVHIAYPMRGQINLAILMVGELVFPVAKVCQFLVPSRVVEGS